MKKLVIGCLLAIIAAPMVGAWFLVGSGTAFEEKTKTFVLEKEQTTADAVVEVMVQKHIINNAFVFKLLASKMQVWEKVQPGKYEVEHGQTLISIARMLRKNRQAEVKLVINKVRTKQELAHLISKNFIHDSANVVSFLNNPSALQAFGADTNSVMGFIVPDTYSFYYNTSLPNMFAKLTDAYHTFWNNARQQKAKNKGLSPQQITIIASIVEEETNKNSDKGNIASVYMNRLAKGMFLGADPTIKFALNDFALKRILFGHLNVSSPYNTYRNKGLPPGPICTPSQATIDAVLDAPATNYLFFVAKANLDGYHHFSATFAEHSQYAKQYQAALNAYFAQKQTNKATEQP